MNKKLHLTLAMLFFPLLVFAEVPKWQIVASQSVIKFTATQNNAPVSGTFKKLTGNITFSPEQLKESKVKIEIDMNSVSASYQDIVTTLQSSDWFDVKAFPNASFESNEISKKDNNQYAAKGNLTIRDKTVPITIDFTIDDYAKDTFHAKGQTRLKRSTFGVGQGEWSSTDEIEDEVKVDFQLLLKLV